MCSAGRHELEQLLASDCDIPVFDFPICDFPVCLTCLSFDVHVFDLPLTDFPLNLLSLTFFKIRIVEGCETTSCNSVARHIGEVNS